MPETSEDLLREVLYCLNTIPNFGYPTTGGRKHYSYALADKIELHLKSLQPSG